jgi:hypothetical protein
LALHDNPSRRPRLDVERTFSDYVGEAAAAVGVLFGIGILIFIWGEIPEQVPRHFGVTGEPTAWDGRWSAAAPIVIAITMYIGLTTLNRIPHHFNFPWPIAEHNAAIQYRLAKSMLTWLKAVIVWMFVAIVWGQLRVALGDAEGLHPLLIMGFLIAIHAILAIFLYRAYKWRDGEVGDAERAGAGRGDS